MKAFRGAWPLYLFPVGVFFLLFFLYPMIDGLLGSLRPLGVEGLSLANYVRFFSDPRMLRVLRFTVFDLGVVVTSLSLLIAIPLAYKLRKRFRGVSVFRALVSFPMGYSGIIAVSIVFFAFSGWGLLNLSLMRLGLIDRPLELVGNFTGVVLASIYQQVPVLFLFILAALAGIEPSLEEAAKTLGASEWQVFRRVVFPLALPAISTAAILGYVLNYGAFVTAIIPGEPVRLTRTLMIEAHDQAFRWFDWPMALTVTMVAAGFGLILVFTYLQLQRRMMRGARGG